MKNRIKEVRIAAALSQADFGSKIGVTSAAVSRWESGERGVPDSAILLVCREFLVSEVWLRTGTGEMKASRSREEELCELIASLMAGRPESFRSSLVTTLLRFDPAGPEWDVLEKIYEDVAAQKEEATGD